MRWRIGIGLLLVACGALLWGVIAWSSYVFTGGYLTGPIEFGDLTTQRIVESITGAWALLHLGVVASARANRTRHWRFGVATVLAGDLVFLAAIAIRAAASGEESAHVLVPCGFAAVAVATAILLIPRPRRARRARTTGSASA